MAKENSESIIKIRQNCKIVKAPLAFGSRQKRFMEIGFHPNLSVRPGTFKCSKIYPGLYEPRIPGKVKLLVPSWDKQLLIEEYSKRLGYVGDHILKERKRMKTVNGPGWQDAVELPSEKSINFSKAPRFVQKGSINVPGPGTYGKNHIPPIWDKNRSFSILPPFEHRREIGRGVPIFRTYHLPPNLYNPPSSIDELIRKRVSKRGPYDLFSGTRFPEKPMEDKPQIRQQKIIYSCCSSTRNEFKGKFPRCGKNSPLTTRISLKCTALTGKNPLDPGPSDYNPYPPRAFTPAPCSFGCSLLENRSQGTRYSILPPPGRYNIDKKTIKGNGCRSVFISKTKRGLITKEKHSWFE